MSQLLSKEQIEFQELLRSFSEAECPLSYVRKRFEVPNSVDIEFESRLKQLDLYSFFGGRADNDGPCFLELALIGFESGRVLLPLPLTETLLGGPFLTRVVLESAQRQEIDSALGAKTSDRILSGELRVAFAHNARNTITAKKSKGKTQVSGEINFVKGMAQAGCLVVVAPEKGGAGSSIIFGLLHEGSNSGIATSVENTIDRTICQYHTTVKEIPAIKLSTKTSLQALWNILTAAELAGMVERTVAMTVEYVKIRRQFDLPIGGFQAVQHRLADLYLRAQALEKLAIFAAWAADYSPDQLELASNTAIAYATAHASEIIEQCIQLHGGIGFTWEHDLHLFLRRAKNTELLHGGNSDFARELINSVNQ